MPSLKAIRKKVMVKEDRIVLLPKIIPEIWPHYGLALLYQNRPISFDGHPPIGAVMKGIARYEKKDSHLCLAKEELPNSLYLSETDAEIITKYGIEIPMRTLVIIQEWI